jgi:hypothetical protein
MRFYRLTDEHVMAMPVSRFWFLYEMLPRVRADESLDLLEIAVRSNVESGPKLYEGYRSALIKLKGSVTSADAPAVLDDAPEPGYQAKLRRLAAMG